MRIRMTFLTGIVTLSALASNAASSQAHLARPVSSFVPTGVSFPVGVAVDQVTGSVYVAGLSSSNVERFNALGRLDRSFVSPTLAGPWGVAVDNSGGTSKGDVYVAESGAGAVDKLDPSGKPVTSFTKIVEGSFPTGDPGSEGFSPHGVAVDPSNGDVIVEDEAHGEVDIFSPSGAFISQFVGGSIGVAAGSGGDIFTSGGEGAQEFSPIDGYATPTTLDPNGEFDVAADLATGDLFSDDGSYIAEYEASGAPLLQFGSGALGLSAGLTVNEETNTVYATDISSGNVYVFGAPFTLPDVSTGAPPTTVTSTTATLEGTVNPDTTSVTGCRFEYGASSSYGASVPCAQALPLTGTNAVPVSVNLSSLQANQTYHYRVVASTSEGTSVGEDESFTTPTAPPTIDDQSTSALRETSAILNASINPNNQTTTYHFEYGTSTVYSASVPMRDAEAGSGAGDVVVAQQISGLEPGITYHYRVTATNTTGPSIGVDQTFTTPMALPPIVTTGPASGTTQNVTTISGTIDTQGTRTTYEFDFGADTSYGTRIFGDAGSNAGQQTFTVNMSGLIPETTYHYRLVASNTNATTYGTDKTFTTPGFPSTVIAAPISTPLVPTPPTTSSQAKAVAPKPTGRSTQPKKKIKEKAKKRAKKATRSAPSRKRRS